MQTKAVFLLVLLTAGIGMVACGDKSTPTTAPTAAIEPAQATDESATAEPIPASQPRFEYTRCPFKLPAEQQEGKTVECGYLIVPENRDDPNSTTIRLAAAIFHPPDGASEADPIIYLAGGPGASALEFMYLAFDKNFAPLFATHRDVIALDQRGVGLSEPALDCPELTELGPELMDYELDGKELDDDEIDALMAAGMQKCQKDLAQKADLSAYHTAANAADVNDLRLALGYDQVNLWGVSYGTRLALDVVRDYPEGLRSVVLDSVHPPDVDLYLSTPANLARALDTLFDACAADAACNAAYPELETVFWETVDQLNDQPVTIEIVNALTKERYDARVDGDFMIGVLFRFLYLTDVVPYLPQIIYDASAGAFDLVALVQGSLLAEAEAMSAGMQFAVQCHDEFSFSSREDYQAVLTEYPRLAELLQDSTLGEVGFDICDQWDVGQADPVENQPVSGAVPTLLMAGEYDPITPPAWAQHATKTLSHGYVFVYPGVGHGASAVTGCPRDMMLAFINDPSHPPDAACIGDMGIEFVVPTDEFETVEMEPFTNDAMGIQGVKPVGWAESSPGVFARGDSGLDVAALIEQGATTSADNLLALLTLQLALEETPTGVGSRDANGLAWELYAATTQGVQVDFALAERDGQAFVVLLQSMPAEHDVLYRTVYLPALDALKPSD